MNSDPSAQTPAGSRRPRLLSLAALILITLPFIYCVSLVRDYAVNAPHYDDFAFAEDWLKFRHGDLTWTDLWAVHLEHRVTTLRLLVLATHMIGGPDMRWQNGLTLLMLGGIFWNVVVLWRRTTGETLRVSWLPLLLASLFIFSPVQWQGLLWPILFHIVVGGFAFTILMRLWYSNLNPWTAIACSIPLCAAGTLSFSTGLLSWLLLPPAIWFLRPQHAAAVRARLIGVWTVITILAFAAYFTNFHNSAPAPYAYNYGDQMTAWDTIKRFLLDPDLGLFDKILKAADFTWSILGSHLCRGMTTNILYTSRDIGCVIFLLFLGVLIWLWTGRKDSRLLKDAAPWVLIGLWSLGSAMLIMIGRVGMTKSGTKPLENRYIGHGILFAVALLALAWMFGRRFKAKLTWLRPAGMMAAGALLLLEAIQWNYGVLRMDLWRNARLQGKAQLMFARKGLMPDPSFLGPVSGDGTIAVDVMTGLDAIGQSPVPLLKSLVVSEEHFHINKSPLLAKFGAFTELREDPAGGLMARGWSILPTRRPADLVLFTTPDENGHEKIFAITYLIRQPVYLHDASQKENEWCSMGGMDADWTSQWEENIALAQKPAAGAPIKAWAMDVSESKPKLYLVNDIRISNDVLPALPANKKEPYDKEKSS